MVELIKDIIESFKDRVKNPLILAYILSFLFGNAELVSFYVFSKGTIEFKHEYIRLFIFSNKCEVFIYPLLLAIVYVFLVPWVTLLFNLATKYPISRSKEIIMSQVTRELQEIEKRNLILKEQGLNDRLSQMLKDRKLLEHLTRLMDLSSFTSFYDDIAGKRRTTQSKYASVERFQLFLNKDDCKTSDGNLNSAMSKFKIALNELMSELNRVKMHTQDENGNSINSFENANPDFFTFPNSQPKYLELFDEFWIQKKRYETAIGEEELIHL